MQARRSKSAPQPTAGESTYAGIVRMVNAAQTAKAPFIRLADRYALLLFPITLIIAGAAWLLSGDPIRGLAVLVAATPCPLILAAPVAFIAGVAQAARLGILIKGGRPFEALARTHTVMFDKTGTVDGRRRSSRCDRDCARREARRSSADGRFSGTGLAPCRRRRHCGGARRQGSRPAGSIPSARDHGIRTGGRRSTDERSGSDPINWSMGPASRKNGPCARSDARHGGPH